MEFLLFSVIIIAAFFLGSIPFSLFLGFIIGKVDIRTKGSGNVGATNLGRVCGWRWFPLAFLMDFSKGALPPFLITLNLFSPDLSERSLLILKVFLGLAPVMGHIFSPFLKFKGGKGVSTGAGAMLVLLPLETGIAFLVWLIMLSVTRTIGASSPVAAISLPIAFFCRFHTPDQKFLLGGLSVVLALFIIYRHKKNLKDYLFSIKAIKGPPQNT